MMMEERSAGYALMWNGDRSVALGLVRSLATEEVVYMLEQHQQQRLGIAAAAVIDTDDEVMEWQLSPNLTAKQQAEFEESKL